MMNTKILLFGITKDLLQNASLEIEIAENTSVKALKEQLRIKHPQLNKIDTYAIAINEAYADDTVIIQKNDVIAIIPPVSGG